MPILNLIDVDGFLFEACMGLESSTTDPHPSWSCTAVETHINKYINEVITPQLGEGITHQFIKKDVNSENFRNRLYPQYKKNRDPSKRPKNEQEIQDFLVKKYNCWLASGQESDDLIGIYTTINGANNTFITTGDGDLCMIDAHILMPQKWNQKWCKRPFFVEQPGVMYLDYSHVDKKSGNIKCKDVCATGIKLFYMKMLAGDTSDNVKSIYGLGKMKAYELLRYANSEKELCDIVKDQYKKAYTENWENMMNLHGRVLWVRRKWNEMWEIPY